MAFNQVAGPIAVPTTGTETTLVSQSVAVTAGQELKIDWATGFEVVNTSNYNVVAEFRTYRDATLISTRILNRTAAAAGTQRFPIANTLVDTAPATASSTYSLRCAITTATNITSGSGNNNNLNIIVF